MADLADSFKQFNYWLRPSKQVERKIMIEILQSVREAGYPIPSYKYVGFGSVYYADFVMFHKFLCISDMTCVEWSDIPKRMKFNKPYKFIKLRMQSFEDALPNVIRPHSKYIVWLDYDRQLDVEMLRDIDNCLMRLPCQSVFVITVDARARVPKEHIEAEEMNPRQQQRWLLDTFNDTFRSLVGHRVAKEDIEPNQVPALYYDAISERIKQTLASRGEAQFVQLFNYIYADGAPMLTIGGIVGAPSDAEKLAPVIEGPFVRQGANALRIAVPPLTHREKEWLDSNLNCTSARFELDDGFLESYQRFYRQYPSFVEALT